MLEVIFLSIVQGVTEFLPISSSAHLILVSKYFNFNNESLTLNISLHLGSLLAIIFYFKEDFKNFINNKVLFFKIILSSIPLMFFGFLLIKFNLIDFLRSYKIIGWSTVFFGILLYLSDLIKVKKTIKKDFNFSSALYIGFFQVLALIPGVSRSGITITGARFFNFSRFDSARISFLTAIPALTAVSIYGFRKVLLEENLEVSIINLFSIFLSFIFSYITIKFFFKFIKKFTLFYFMVYRIILGLIILFYAY